MIGINRKKAAGELVIFGTILAIVLLIWLIIYSQRECHDNAECPTDAYCGSDFSCHKYPATTQVLKRTDFTAAAFLIGLAIVVAAVILRKKQSVPRDNIEPKVIQTKGDHSPDEQTGHLHHHHHEHDSGKSALEKFEKGGRKDSQSLEKYGEDAHSHTPKHH